MPYDGYSEEVVLDEDGLPSTLTLPITQVEYLHREPGRGMMSFDGRHDPTYGRYLASLPTDELKFALAKENSAKALSFLADLVDPNKADTDIVTLAKLNKIGLPEMMQIWRSHRLVSAMNVLVEHSPVIARHTVEDAKSYKACCPRCDGAGVIKVNRRDIYEWIECPSCSGKGAVRKPGEHKSRQQIFEAIGVISQKPTVVVNNQVNNSVESVIEELDSTTIDTKSEGND